MGSGNWFKIILGRKGSKQGRQKKHKGSANERSNTSKRISHSKSKVSNALCNGSAEDSGSTLEDRAARKIQNAYRSLRARRALRRLKGVKRLEVIGEGHSIKKQTSSTLSYIQSWSRIQSEIRTRRACMVTEGRIKQKKQENQLKLEAKLHDIEVDWCGGSDTMEEILSRIHQREEAAVKRERAMAYAFSHQWRANSGNHLPYEFGKGECGWSWVERWIAARPWETRLPLQQTSPEKAQTKPARAADKKPITNPAKPSVTVKTPATGGKTPAKRNSLKPLGEKTKAKEEEHHHPPQEGATPA